MLVVKLTWMMRGDIREERRVMWGPDDGCEGLMLRRSVPAQISGLLGVASWSLEVVRGGGSIVSTRLLRNGLR